MPKLLPLFCSHNLVDNVVREEFPWDFEPDPEQEKKFQDTPKPERTKKILNVPETRWCCYSASFGQARGAITSKDGGANPVAGLRGFTADFDHEVSQEEAEKSIRADLPEALWPQFLDLGFTGHIRLSWIFDRDVSVTGSDMADAIIARGHAKLHLDQLLLGYDDASIRAFQRWTRGTKIVIFKKSPLDTAWIEGIRFELLQLEASQSKNTVDVKTLEARAHELFPNRWQGPFEFERIGVRFWDKQADNPRGAQLFPHGVFTITGERKGLISWGDILGPEWYKHQQTSQLGVITKDMYSDAKGYWTRDMGGQWVTEGAERIACRLRVRGLSGIKKKGQNASEIDEALDFINQERRINAAAPLLYKPEGVVTIHGKRILNISTVRAMTPGRPAAAPQDFPWVWEFLNGFLERPELGSVDNLLAWIQRSYVGAYNLAPNKGQALFLCGPKDTGKTLFTDKILAPLLGGESANPFEFFTGRNRFTDHLLTVGLLAINDEEAPEGRDREAFLQKIKAFSVNNLFKFEAKGKEAATVDWCGRLIITLNETPKDLRILPELNSNTADKIQFYATKPYGGIFPEKRTLEAQIANELPLLARWLLDSYTPQPETLIGGRMGVAPFHDPMVVEKALQQQPEWHFLCLLEGWVNQVHGAERTEPEDWIGQPMALYNELHAMAQSGLAGVREYTVNRVATALGSLVRQDREAIKSEPGHGYRIIKRLLKKTS